MHSEHTDMHEVKYTLGAVYVIAI